MAGLDWNNPVAGDPLNTYTASLDLGATALTTLLSPDAAGSTAVEQDYIDVMGALSAQVPGEARPRATQNLAVRVFNNVVKTTEALTTPANPAYPSSAAVVAAVAEAGMAKYALPTITSAIGSGSATDLSGVVDTNFQTYQSVEIPEYLTNPGVGVTTWILEPSTTPAVVGQRQCATYTEGNARIWRKRSLNVPTGLYQFDQATPRTFTRLP